MNFETIAPLFLAPPTSGSDKVAAGNSLIHVERGSAVAVRVGSEPVGDTDHPVLTRPAETGTWSSDAEECVDFVLVADGNYVFLDGGR